MRRAIFVLLCLVLAVSMAAIPADTIGARPASSPELSPASPGQQEDEKALIEDILDELQYARGKLTKDKVTRDHIKAIEDWVKKLEEFEKRGDTEGAIQIKLVIAERLEWLINQLPQEAPSTSTQMFTAAAPTTPSANPLYEELVRIRAKIEKLIELEREVVGLVPLTPITPEIQRPPEMERLIVYSAKFLCGPAFGKEGVQPGSYSTAINVHNPHSQTVYLYKKVVIAEREDEPRGRISAFRKVALRADEAIEIDCIDIGILLRPREPGKPTDGAKCPQGCYCLTREDAGKRGYTSLCRDAPCDKDASGNPMYCFREPPPTEEVECPQGCLCMTEAAAEERGYPKCQNQTIQCGSTVSTTTTATAATTVPMYCYEKPTAEAECPTGCYCLSEADARKRGYTSLCQNEPCDTDASGNLMYCYKQPPEEEQAECPKPCVCLTEAEAEERGYTWCEGVRRQCGYDSAGNQMFCFESATTQSGPTRIVKAMPEETGLTVPSEQGGTVSRVPTVTPVSSLVRFVKGFVVIYATAPLDVVAVYTASTPVGFSLDIEYLQPSTRGVVPIPIPEEPKEPPPTQAECPKPCLCLTEAEAKERGLTWCDGVRRSCGYSDSGVEKFCFEKPPQEVECPTGCYCMTQAAAQEKGLTTKCMDRPCAYEPDQTPRYCFSERTTEEVQCPKPCLCMTQAEAEERGYTRCPEETRQCGYDEYQNPKFCFERPPVEVECPKPCQCFTEVEARKYGYTSWCQGQQVQCGYDEYQNPKFCFERPPEEVQCPKPCVCMTEAEAKRYGYVSRCQGQQVQCGRDDYGNPKYCSEKPIEEVKPARMTLQPGVDYNAPGTRHTVTATVWGSDGKPMSGVPVTFTVSGTVRTSGTATTNASGQAGFSYGSKAEGQDTITATADGLRATATKYWEHLR